MKKWMETETRVGGHFSALVPGCLTHHGGSNSRKGDFEIGTTGHYLEIKSPKSQAGQMVLIPDFERKRFDYSPRSLYRLGPHGQSLVDLATAEFDTITALAGGENYHLDAAQPLLLAALHEAAVAKKTAFFASLGDDMMPLVFSRPRLADHIRIRAAVRRKQSGSRPINKGDIPTAVEMFKKIGQDIQISDRGKITGSSKMDGFSISFGKNVVVFSGLGTNEASARILGTTRNLNLMLVVDVFGVQDPKDLNDFIEYAQSHR